MSLVAFLFRRLLLIIPVLIGITLVTFTVSHAVPADPIAANLGQLAQDNPAIVGQYRHKWGLDRPLPVQYVIYVKNLLQGDLGESISTQRPVTDDLKQYFPATMELSVAALLFALFVGVPLGVIAATRRDGPIDHVARGISLVGVATPVFWLGLMALVIFYSRLGWAPGPGQLNADYNPPPTVTGMIVVDSIIAGDTDDLTNSLEHLVLPALVLGSYTMGLITRMTRSNMVEALAQDYVRTARAKGVRRRRIVYRHALRNAFIPTLTLLGLSFGSLLSGAVLTETIFSWQGIGSYATKTAALLDYPAIMGVALVTAVVYVFVNLVVDVLYGVLNPQIRVR
ncbi:MAG TPA: ABC transporter permease [Chloroflexota bacterium]|nr:ABC transporter permease [Chloroflexota bacterium]